MYPSPAKGGLNKEKGCGQIAKGAKGEGEAKWEVGSSRAWAGDDNLFICSGRRPTAGSVEVPLA
eukprot:scaffold5291_cov129-Isochrysis_galbana.AAC.2